MWLFNLKKTKNILPTLSNRFLQEMSAQQETLALRSHFKEILKTLHEHHLEKLPWYLILGPEQSGKTTLLSQPSYHWSHTIPSFFATRAPKTNDNAPQLLHPIYARINQDGVFIEIPGRYLQEKTHKRSVFGTFLHLLKQHKINTLLRGITLILSLDDLAKLSTQKQQEQIYTLKHCLAEVGQILKQPINLQLLLSKTDTLIGFNEFFSETLQEERLDVFGIEFPEQAFSPTRPANEAFNQQFTLLLAKLNERIISLLHRERLANKKALITDFPQQLASFKELLNHYIYDLCDIAPYQNKLLLRSIHFFSNAHHGETVDHLANLLSLYHLPARTNSVETLKPKSYFASRLLKKMTSMSAAPKIISGETFTIPRSSWLILAFLAGLIPLIYLGISFHQKVQVLNQLQQEFSAHTQNNFSTDTNQALLNQINALSSLQKTIQLVKNLPLSSLIGFNWHPLHNLSVHAQQNYQHLLEHQFIPLLCNTLTRDLLNASIANTNHLYPELKAYLALSNPKKNADYLAKWLKTELLAVNFKEARFEKLNFQEIDFSTWPEIKLDNPAILHAQSILKHLPKPFLSYLVLKGEMIGTIDPFPKDFDKIFIYPATMREVPIIYTREKIANVYFDQIPIASNVAFSGNEVLGKQFFTEVSPNDLATVVAQVREFYLQDYAQNWQHILTHTQIKLANDFKTALTILQALSQKPSPIALLLQTITQQTTLDISALSQKRSLIEQQNFYHHFKDHFSMNDATNRLLAAKPQLITQTIQPEIIKLHKTLANVTNSADVKKAAFQLVKQEYQTQKTFGKLAKAAFEMPQPLSRWLISLISNDWLLLLQTTHNYTNQVWRNLVMPEYRAKLNERYPFTRQAAIDVELADFAHFFGKEGTLDTFANQYLLPFIDTNRPRWQWRELYGQSLSNNNDLPLQLERAALIRKMFFSKTGELAVEFYFMPMALGPMLKGMQLSIDGQQISSQIQNLTSAPFIWPGVKNCDGSNLTFLKQTGEHILLAEKGPWSLFRLLDNAYIQPMRDAKHYSVVFDLNGNAAKYQLVAENAVNPFIPNFITQFTCVDEF